MISAGVDLGAIPGRGQQAGDPAIRGRARIRLWRRSHVRVPVAGAVEDCEIAFARGILVIVQRLRAPDDRGSTTRSNEGPRGHKEHVRAHDRAYRAPPGTESN